MIETEQIRRLYWEEKLSLLGVGKIVGLSESGVWYQMKREGIPTRPSSQALNLAYIMQRHGKPEGRKHPNWHNGEHLGSDGYVRILAPWHPFAQCMGHVRRARLVMEDIIGRFMKPEEEIHHRNGKRWDDRPENLELMASKGQHRSQENNLQNKKEMR